MTLKWMDVSGIDCEIKNETEGFKNNIILPFIGKIRVECFYFSLQMIQRFNFEFKEQYSSTVH